MLKQPFWYRKLKEDVVKR